MGKIGITCRQPFLGADEWIAEEIKKSSDTKSGEKTKEKEVGKQKKPVEVKEK
jgi:DNA-directed RNA polymerase subunit E'